MDLIYIKPEETTLKIKEGALLIHTLPAEHFAKIHLPGAVNACVYQVTFLSDVRTVCPDKDRAIVLYGSSTQSLDASTATQLPTLDGDYQVDTGASVVGWSGRNRNSKHYGSLSLRGVTKNLEFSATIAPLEDGNLGLEAHFDIDRTRWNVIYGSTRFFEHLGMHTVFDQINIELRLVLKGADING